MTKTKIEHGGARPGAGRPKQADGTTKDRRVSLDDHTVAIMRQIGDGNLSKGIRKAADLLGPTVDKQP